MQDIRSGSNRVSSEENGQPALFRSGNQSEGHCLVTHDGTVITGIHFGFLHGVSSGKGFRGITVVITGLQHFHVTVKDLRFLAEFIFQKVDGIFHIPVVHPVQETENKHILRPVFFFHTQGCIL